MDEALSVYSVTNTYANLDSNLPWFLFFGGFALIFNFIYFGSGIVQGFKHRIVTIPIFWTAIFIVHDFGYLLMWDKWFNHYDHWFSKLYWVGLIITNIQEAFYFYIAVRWSRGEFMPQVPQWLYTIYMFAALGAAAVGFWAVKMVLADELWLFTFGFLTLTCLTFIIPTMLRRNSSLGNTPLMWGSFIGMCICYWTAMWPLDPFFRSAPWLTVLALDIVWALAIIYIIRKLPKNRDFVREAV